MSISLIGQTLSNYQIVSEIGRGGMAVVYKAYQPSLNRYVALKVLHSYLGYDQAFVTRFLREARTAANLSHPNIIKIHEAGEASGIYFIAMEFVGGGSLHSRMQQRRGPLDLVTALNLLTQIASALDYAHAQGIVHRDVKPSNVLLTQQGHAVLTDFGIAKAAAETKITRTGVLIGTPEYMSPEQAEGLTADYRTDLYSLGIVLYEMVTGRVPFTGDTPTAILYAHAHKAPPPPRSFNPTLTSSVETVVLKALAKKPAARFQSATDMAAALRAATAGAYRPPKRTNILPIAVASVIVVLLLCLVAVAGTLLGSGIQQIAVATTRVPTPARDTVPTDVPFATAPLQPTTTPVVIVVTATPRPATATRKPTDTPRPSPTQAGPPTCSIPVGATFLGIWSDPSIYQRLGCPSNSQHQSASAVESFEHGWMLWRDNRGDLDSTYAVFADGTYRAFSRLTDSFNEGIDPEYSCGPKSSPPSPRRGFSKIWCKYSDVRAKLGNATEYEIGYCMPGGGACETFQDFAGGMMYRSTRFGAVFVLFSDGRWRRGDMPPVITPPARTVEYLGSAWPEKWALNNASGFSDVSVEPANRDGKAVIALSYAIRGDPPNNYAGVNLCFSPPRSWMGYNGLTVWIENDSIAKNAVVQFGERQCPEGNFVYFKDEVWKRNVSLVSSAKGPIKISFDSFRWASEFSPAGNGQVDLDSIVYLGLYIEAPRGARGVVYFGEIYLTP